ncbi:MAG TPA: type III-A CRISPR-associated protein Cas10/Csm1, partial [Bacteroidetes bacterium]|nr:type III-A CRISPR-associated protein Cas10/Csm1 [Bacteroidota bacterium]
MEKSVVFFGALLHDIGKFYERSKQYHLKKDKSVDRYSHAEYSAFVLKTLHGQIDFFKQLPETIVEIAKTHHAPRTPEGKIVQLTDWLSSGERMEDQSVTDYYVNIALISVFSQIYPAGNSVEPEKQWGCDLVPLSFDSVFPSIEACAGKDAYQALVDTFNSRLVGINSTEELLALMEKYLSLVPAQTTRFRADISLYDHMRGTAAIALCLYHQMQNGALDEQQIDRIRESLNKQPVEDRSFILIHADLSGIQKFVFNVTSKGAAKSLKGRSTYLMLLMESIAHFFVNELDLEPTNILYNGGGNFYLLAPAVFEEKIQNLRKTVNRRLFQIHGGELFCNIGYCQFSAYHFIQQFQDIWTQATANTAILKQQKISEIWEDEYDLLFQPAGEIHTHACRICHSTENVVMDDEDIEICSFCQSFKKLAKDIKDCRYIGMSDIEVEEISFGTVTDWQAALAVFGREYSFYKEWPKRTEEKVYALNNFDDKNTPLFRFGALPLALEPDFDILAENKRLAFLKLDVDNLGEIFKKGLQPASISRVAVLSRMLRLFFEGYLPYMIDSNKKYREDIYIVFSGGDDSFLIGKPQTMVKFAGELRQKFAEFTA